MLLVYSVQLTQSRPGIAISQTDRMLKCMTVQMAVVEHVPLTQLRSILDDIHAAVKEATSGSPPAVTPQVAQPPVSVSAGCHTALLLQP